MIPLAKPSITQADIDVVTAVLRSCRLSIGPMVEQFEAELAKIAGVKYAVCVNSGTSALELIVKAMDIGDGDEVICPSFSFIASANCIVSAGAIPVFVDIEPHTYCLDAKQVESAITDNTKAILAVDLFGNLPNWDMLIGLAGQYSLDLIEDACEAIGSSKHGFPAGSWGDAACFSFYPNKQITCGEGGVILTNDKVLADYGVAMRNQGRTGTGWLSHDLIGHNYRMTEMQAALGLSQLARLESLMMHRRHISSLYTASFQDCDDVQTPLASLEDSPFVYVVQLASHFGRIDRDVIISGMAERGIECRAYFPPIHLQPVYREKFGYQDGLLPITEAVADRTIALPFYPDLTEEEVKEVCDSLKLELHYRLKVKT